MPKKKRRVNKQPAPADHHVVAASMMPPGMSRNTLTTAAGSNQNTQNYSNSPMAVQQQRQQHADMNSAVIGGATSDDVGNASAVDSASDFMEARNFPVPADEGEMCKRSCHQKNRGNSSAENATTTFTPYGTNRSETASANSRYRSMAVIASDAPVVAASAEAFQQHDLAISAEVVPDDDVDLEARLQAQLREQREHLEREVHQQMINQAVYADVVTTIPAEGTEAGYDDDPREQIQAKHYRRRRIWCIGVVLLLLVVGGIGAGIAVSHSRASDASNTQTQQSFSAVPTQQSSPSPSWAPTHTPSLNPTQSLSPSAAPTLSRFGVLSQRLADVLGGENILLNESVQFETLQWLVYNDNFTAMIPATSIPLATLVNRYVAALFYFSMDGYGWNDQYQFLTNSSVCEWNNVEAGKGIFCNDNEDIVTIQLDQTNLRGSLPRELGELTLLQRLNLQNNQISGPIPDTFGSLTRLDFVSFGLNRLTGAIPTEFGQMTALSTIDMRQNRLTGSLPPELANLTNVKFVTLNANMIEGMVPIEFRSWAQILTALWLDQNNLSGDLNPVFCNGPRVIPNLRADCNERVVCNCCLGCA